MGWDGGMGWWLGKCGFVPGSSAPHACGWAPRCEVPYTPRLALHAGLATDAERVQ